MKDKAYRLEDEKLNKEAHLKDEELLVKQQAALGQHHSLHSIMHEGHRHHQLQRG